MIVNRFVPSSEIFNVQGNTDNSVATNNSMTSFADTLKSQLDSVNEKQIESDVLNDKLIKGDGNVNIHQVMLSTEEAKMSVNLAIQVRNKLVEAYQEISKIQL